MDSLGEIQKFDAGLDDVLDPQGSIEVIASDFKWTEGPAWDAARRRLLFSDIPSNKIHVWSEEEGLSTLLHPAGRQGETVDKHVMPGTNGLWMESKDGLLICNQDARSVDRLNLVTMERKSVTRLLTEGPFNSPNDVISSCAGRVYFTDPPFGLLDQKSFAGMKLGYRGVFRVEKNGEAFADVKDMTFPNGLVFSLNESVLYVSQSDREKPVIMRFEMEKGGRIGKGDVFYNTISFNESGDPGLPDGMTVDENGVIFATCAGGVVILSPEGILLGRLRTGKATANCTFGEDGATLFITAHDTLLRVRTRTRGLGF